MCYRHLRFNKFLECGHLTFTGDTYFDCNERVCFLSTSHPADCGTNGKPACKCRRYYTYVIFYALARPPPSSAAPPPASPCASTPT